MAQFKKWTDEKKLLYDIKLHKELHENYLLVSKLAIVCIRKGLKLIIENPYSVQHYLRNYWCIKPRIIDKNRRENGDYLKKPTQYFFIGFEPKNNLVFEPLEPVEMRVHEFMTGSDGKTRQVKRSEMHPQYANRFIRQYILESED